jgi:plastocyanin
MNRFRAAAGALALGGLMACASAPAPERPSSAMADAAPVAPAPAPAPLPAPVQAPEPIAPAPATAMPEAVEPPVVATAPAPVPAKPAPARKPPPPKPEAKPAAPKPEAKPVASGNTVSGRLELVAGSAGAVMPGELADGLVYFLPKAGAPKPKPGTFTIDTRSKGFSPALLVVPQGSTVRFPNRDTILHNVFSRTPGSSFDFGHYGPGESKQYVFNKPGLVIVNCNVHHNMRADVVVLATPYYTRPDRNGRYTLADLPAGPGTLVFWHPRAQAQSVAVAMPVAAPVTRRMTAIRPARQEH